MNIQISRESGVPIHLQLEKQIAFLIATGKLKPGTYLPSVRALAKRLNIHHNTVSQAYQYLVSQCLVERQRGSRMVVPSQKIQINVKEVKDIDDVINIAIRVAQNQGITLQQLGQRIHEQLMAQPPDHLLIVGDEPEMRHLVSAELKPFLSCPISSCSPEELSSSHSLVIGALVAGIAGNLRKLSNLLRKNHPTSMLKIETADRYISLVKEIREPSLIAVISISEFFLQTAKGLLAPVIGGNHSLNQYLLPSEKPRTLHPFRLVFCDSIAYRQFKGSNIIRYNLISADSINEIKHILADRNSSDT